MSNCHFNKVASQYYESMSEIEKAKLIEEVSSDVEMTQQDVVKKVRKIFCQIQNMVSGGMINLFCLKHLLFPVSETGRLRLQGVVCSIQW